MQEIIRAFAYLKHGAALANRDAGVLSDDKLQMIAQVVAIYVVVEYASHQSLHVTGL